MTTLEIRENLISKINITEDHEILSGVLDLLEFELDGNEGYTLTDIQKKSIALSKQQIKEGKVFTDIEADKLTDKWLNK